MIRNFAQVLNFAFMLWNKFPFKCFSFHNIREASNINTWQKFPLRKELVLKAYRLFVRLFDCTGMLVQWFDTLKVWHSVISAGELSNKNISQMFDCCYSCEGRTLTMNTWSEMLMLESIPLRKHKLDSWLELAETEFWDIQAIEDFFRDYIASSKHEGAWENSRQLWKPETQWRVCITFREFSKLPEFLDEAM